MDINSKKFQTTISKFKKFSLLTNILLVSMVLGVLVFVNNKKDALLIVALIVFGKVSIVYMFDNIKIVIFLQQIREISNMNYCVNEILDKTDEKSEVSILLGKKYKSILEKIHKVEKYTYETTLKGKQSENMANTVVENIGKNLTEPVANIEKGIEILKTNINNETLDYIEKEAYKMKDTINELFELSKAVTKTLDINIERLDLISLTKQALIEYEGKFEENKITIKRIIPNEKIYVNADGNKLWRVLEILLDNVAKHSEERTRAHIEIKEKEHDIELSLINISKNELNMDLDRLYKNIKENKKLGIPIAISLIEAQDGKINIDIDGDMFKITVLFKNINILEDRGE